MSNDVAHVNYVKRGLKGSQVLTIELFGSPIDCVNGMMRINDVRASYLASIDRKGAAKLKSIDKWLTNSSTASLMEYLEDNHEELGYENMDQVYQTFEGRSGGTFVCRELAHSFAMWLDSCYAIHVLRAFDQLVQGEFAEAHKTASKVAKVFVKMEWAARAERLTSLGMEPDEHFKFLIEDIYYEISGSLLEDPLRLRNYIYENIGDSLIFERILNALELAWKFKDTEEAVEITLAHFHEDPEFPKLVEVLKAYHDIPWES